MRRARLRLTQLENREVPAVATWDGGGNDANWTTTANWLGDVAPNPGDDLVFPVATQRLAAINDFPAGTAFGTISVTQHHYVLSGNTLSLTRLSTDLPLETTNDTDLLIEFGIALTGAPVPVTLARRAVLITGPITGAGGVIKDGVGELRISGMNSYTGPTTLVAGVLQIRSDTALGAVGAGNQTAVQDGATLTLSGNGLVVAEPIAFVGLGVTEYFSGNQTYINIGAVTSAGGSHTLSGPLTLTGDALLSGHLTISSGIGEIGGPHNLTLSFLGVFNFPAGAANTLTGRTSISSTVVFNGKAVGPTDIYNNLSGVGTLGQVHAFEHSFVSPGLAGLTVGDLTLDSGMAVTFGPAGNGHYIVHGTTKVGGMLRAEPTESQVYLGDVLTILNNDGTDAVVGAFDGLPEGAAISSRSPHLRLRVSYAGGDGNDVTLTAVRPMGFAAGAGPGGEPRVNIYDADGNLMRTFLAYPAEFRGGVRVATGDVTGDHLRDVVTAAGPGGGPLVRVWDGVTGAMVREFYAYDANFSGGVSIAAVDVFPDGRADIITGAGPGGGPHVKVFNSFNDLVGAEFFAYDANFRGGVSVAATPGAHGGHILFNGQITTGAGPGGGPHVRIFETDGRVTSEFFAFDPRFRGGVSVARGHSGQVQGLDNAGLFVAPMTDGVPVVQNIDSNMQANISFFAYDQAFRGGVNLAVLPIGQNGAEVILTGAGSSGGPHVREWIFAPGPSVFRELFAFDPTFFGGVFVG